MDWPTGLPAPLLGFTASSDSGAQLRTDGDVAEFQRAIGESGSLKASATWLLSSYDLETFQAWYKYKLNGGLSWYRADLKLGAAIVSLRCRIAGGYVADEVAQDKWKVSASIEINQ